MTPSNLPAVIDQRGVTERDDFQGVERNLSAETALAAVAAREKAVVEAQYIMAERHPRRWLDVGGQMVDHCRRPRFAEVSRYAKPVGKQKNDNGQWEEQFARGFSIRFAETLAQEMGNVKPDASITYEDDRIRIVRISVTDLQKNVPWSREVVFAKTVERRGQKRKNTKGDRPEDFAPPEGREIISSRLNSYGVPTYLVKATDDELRAKINAEISKSHRDFIIKLCPRDILEDCETQIYATLDSEDKKDPLAAGKKWLNGFRSMGVMPSELETYLGKPFSGWGPTEVASLRELAQAIKEGTVTFADALKAKYDQPAGTVADTEKMAEQKIRDLEQAQHEHSAQQQKEAAPAVTETPKAAPAPQQAPPVASATTTYETWDDWGNGGAKEHPKVVIRSGPNAGTFRLDEETREWRAEEPAPAAPTAAAAQPTNRPKPVFGKRGQ